MRRLLCSSLAAAALLALAACGDDEPAADRFSLRTPPEHASAEPLPEVVKARKKAAREAELIRRGLERPAPVIRGWGAALGRNDDAGAARYFKLPAVVSITEKQTLATVAEAKAFNAALPCGVKLIHIERADRFVIGTFELEPRPEHDCDTPGDVIRIGFVLHDRKIAEWRQVQETIDPEATATPEPTPVAPADPRAS